MAITTKSEPRRLSTRQQRGRAVNALADLLQKRLSVPNIYLQPPSAYLSADILVVDRAGSGDLHGVLIKLAGELVTGTGQAAARPYRPTVGQTVMRGHLWQKRLQQIHAQLMSLPTHYRYLAIEREGSDRVIGQLGPLLYSPDGIGRIGIILLTDRGANAPTAELTITPERFRVDAAKLAKIEKAILEKIRPDIEVRI